MNKKFLLFTIVTTLFFSCTSTYKNSQTPDDVYYSPARKIEKTANDNSDSYSSENRQIKMSRYDHRWRYLDNDYDYRYDPYHFGYTYGYYYNPYYYHYPVFNAGITITNPKNSTPRTTNLGSYHNNITIVNPKYKSTQSNISVRSYNNSNNSSSIRQNIYPTGENHTRTYSPGPSSGGNNNSGTQISRPRRG
jgi:hypothetical protein